MGICHRGEHTALKVHIPYHNGIRVLSVSEPRFLFMCTLGGRGDGPSTLHLEILAWDPGSWLRPGPAVVLADSLSSNPLLRVHTWSFSVSDSLSFALSLSFSLEIK